MIDEFQTKQEQDLYYNLKREYFWQQKTREVSLVFGIGFGLLMAYYMNWALISTFTNLIGLELHMVSFFAVIIEAVVIIFFGGLIKLWIDKNNKLAGVRAMDEIMRRRR